MLLAAGMQSPSGFGGDTIRRVSMGASGSARRTADLELVRRARRGEERSVAELIERLRCVPRMLSVKNRQLGHPLRDEELSDLAQQVLVAVWAKLSRFEGRATLETWVYRFCFLEFMHQLRRDRRVPVPSGDLQQDLGERAAETETSGAHEAEEIYKGLEALKQEDAQIVRWRSLDDESFEAIARRLDLPTNTVKTKYYRALLKLRSRLESPTHADRKESLG